MKTTELWMEQVLIGGLGLAIVLLPWLRELQAKLSDVNIAMGLAGGSLALGLAFWLGIPLDRLADTLTERLDRHARLRFALAGAQDQSLPKVDDLDRLDRDVYPEDRLRVSGLRDSDAAVSWIDYHRSRIRLTRALALYGPALTVTLALGLERMRVAPPPGVNLMWFAGLLSAYVLWAVIGRRGPALPRTDRGGLITYAQTWGFVDSGRVVKATSSDFTVWVAEWRTLAVPVALLAVALVRALASGDAWVGAAIVAATVLVAFTAWAWWRISFTFRTYLHALDRYAARA